MNIDFRRVTQDDLPMIVELHKPETAAFLFPKTWRSFPEIVEWIKSVNTPPSSMAWSVLLDGQPVGLVWLYGNDGYHASIGFGLVEKARGSGVGIEAGRRFVALCFRDLGLGRLSAGCAESNAACVALMRRLGFVEEGRLRKATFHDGRYVDNIHFGLLAEEWGA